MHSLANVDAEFDFNESFWRYELSLTRASSHQQPVSGSGTQPRPVVAESPNDRLLETNSEVSPNHPADVNPVRPLATSAARLTVPQSASTSVQQQASAPEAASGPIATAHEDPLTRLHTFLATNSRRNSLSGGDGSDELGGVPGGSGVGLMDGTSGFDDVYNFDFGLGAGLGLGEDLSTLLTNGMRAGSGLGSGLSSRTMDGGGSNGPVGIASFAGGMTDNGWPEGLPRQWGFGD